MDADAVIFLIQAFYAPDALPLGVTDDEFAKILIAFDLLQCSNKYHLKDRIQAFPDSLHDPMPYYTLPVVIAASKHNFPQVLATAFLFRCMINPFRNDDPEDIQVEQAYLNDKFDLLSNVGHEELMKIINGYDYNGNLQVAEKMAREIVGKPQFHTIELLKKADEIDMIPIREALLQLQPPHYLRVGKEKSLASYHFTDVAIKTRLMCMFSNVLTSLEEANKN